LDELDDKEMYWGNFYNVLKDGLNCRLGRGRGLVSDDLRVKMKISNKRKKIKPVLQYDLHGNFIKKWNAVSDAELFLEVNNNTNISACCLGKQKSAWGYIWKYINGPIKNKIEGVVFLTGDRHHSEIIKKERNGTYPLLDITASPLTSGLSKFTGKEKNHPSRIIGIDHTTNYGKISFTGTFKDRKMKIEFIGPGGESLTVYEIDAKDLK
jgi:hypothetical protein